MLNSTSHRFSILIIEDEPGPRDALKMILRPFFTLHTADNAHTAMRLLREQPIDLITLDLKLPDRQGLDLLQDIKLEREDVEVIIITGYGSLKSAMDGIRYGAAAYLLKPFNVTELVSLINQTLEKKQRLDRLRGLLRSSVLHWDTEQEASASWQMLSREYFLAARPPAGGAVRLDDSAELAPLLSDLLEAKSRDLFNHSCRVSSYAGLVADRLGLSPAERKVLTTGAFLHDIGRIGIDEKALRAKGGARDEADLLRRHPEIGARMIGPLQLPAEVGQIICYHHEQFDGSGYPYGLQGDGIPKVAQIVGLAQAFDHQVTEHLFSGQAFGAIEEACDRIRQLAGQRFDPRMVDLFIQVVTENRQTLPALMTSSRSSLLQKP